MTLCFSYEVTITRQDPITGEKTIIYPNIGADIQEVDVFSKNALKGQNSLNSEMADYFIYVGIDKNNLKIGDFIEFENDFGEIVKVKIVSRDAVKFKKFPHFIEIICKLI